MKLYYVPGACSLSPHIVLREGGLAFELEKVDLATRKTESGADFFTINPKGYVPALRLDDGLVMTEGPAIVQFIADQNPKAGLAPPATRRERYELQAWLNFISAELHKQYSPLFNPACTPDQRKAVLETLSRRYTYVADQLKSRDYIFGNAFTVADAYLFTVTNWANFVKFDLGQWPSLVAYQQRIGSRPAVQQALKAEGLLG